MEKEIQGERKKEIYKSKYVFKQMNCVVGTSLTKSLSRCASETSVQLVSLLLLLIKKSTVNSHVIKGRIIGTELDVKSETCEKGNNRELRLKPFKKRFACENPNRMVKTLLGSL